MLRAVDSINGEKRMKLNMKDNNTIFIRMTMTTTTTMTLEKQHQRRGLWREEIERGSKQEEEDEDDDDDDLMVSKLGEDIVMKIMEKLDARSLARSLLVSRSWFSLASSDSLWSPLVIFFFFFFSLSNSFLFSFIILNFRYKVYVICNLLSIIYMHKS